MWVLEPLLLLVLTSLPHWIIGTRLMTVRPVFNYDAVVVLMLGAISWPLGVLAVIGSWIVDGIYSASFTYHFHSPQEFLQSFQFGGNLHVDQFLGWDLCWALPFVVCAVAIALLLRRRRLRWEAGICLLIVLFTLDVANGSSRLSTERRDSWRFDANFVGTVAGNIAFTTYRQLVEPPTMPKPLSQHDVSSHIMRWTGEHEGGNVLLVLMESLGSPVDRQARDWLENQLLTPAVRASWEVHTDDVHFNGTTTDGELRDLCDLSGSYRLLTATNAADCLPRRLKRAGYATRALHGFSGHMFDRTVWWPHIGLDHLRFAEDLPAAPRCGGVFRGVCDDALVTFAVNDLRGTTHQFVYLLTLNTHLPLTPGRVPSDLATVCEERKIPQGSCQLVAQHGQFLRSLADRIATLEQPTLVAIVGDHAPPFAVRHDREQFLPHQVPRIILTPRQSARVPGPTAAKAI
jgi:hypothetical protein